MPNGEVHNFKFSLNIIRVNERNRVGHEGIKRKTELRS